MFSGVFIGKLKLIYSKSYIWEVVFAHGWKVQAAMLIGSYPSNRSPTEVISLHKILVKEQTIKVKSSINQLLNILLRK